MKLPKQDKNKIPVTRLDHNKNVLKHYESINKAKDDTGIGFEAIRYFLKTKQMDWDRKYWIYKK